jgi:hypothetical protein
MTKLSRAMTVGQFDNGYWYATELRRFATELAIPFAHRLRKDELEAAIKGFLGSGELQTPVSGMVTASGERDSERGLSLKLAVANYKNDGATWEFIETGAQTLVHGLKRKSGARYRLNRWREEQVRAGKTVTYGDLVREYVRLSLTAGPFARIPHGRYINFMSDFLAAEKGATWKEALRSWAQVKRLDAPKDYRSWARFHGSKGGRWRPPD